MQLELIDRKSLRRTDRQTDKCADRPVRVKVSVNRFIPDRKTCGQAGGPDAVY